MPPRQRVTKTNKFREEDADVVIAPIPEDERAYDDDDGIPSAPARTAPRPVGQGRRDPALAEAIARGEAGETRTRRRRAPAPEPEPEETIDDYGYDDSFDGDQGDDELDVVAADEGEDEFPLSPQATISVKLSLAFSHRDKNHIVIIGVEDGLFPLVDEHGTIIGIESSEEAGERLQEYVLDRIDKMIARAEFNIDQRLAAKAAEVRRTRGAR